jgi:hypothetical protein
MIFKHALLVEPCPRSSPSLLTALRGDVELYKEALYVFFTVNVFEINKASVANLRRNISMPYVYQIRHLRFLQTQVKSTILQVDLANVKKALERQLGPDLSRNLKLTDGQLLDLTNIQTLQFHTLAPTQNMVPFLISCLNIRWLHLRRVQLDVWVNAPPVLIRSLVDEMNSISLELKESL